MREGGCLDAAVTGTACVVLETHGELQPPEFTLTAPQRHTHARTRQHPVPPVAFGSPFNTHVGVFRAAALSNSSTTSA